MSNFDIYVEISKKEHFNQTNHPIRLGSDPISMKLLLSGKSYDYGKPKFNFVTGKLYVPKDYKGLRIEYNGDSFVDYVKVSEQFEISYFWCLEEISLVSSKFL